MKRHSLSFRHMLYLSLHSIGQNLLRTFVTVLLLTACASAFGCASSTFLDYSKTQSQLFLSSEDSVFSIAKFDWSNNVKEEGSLFEYVSVAGPQTRDTAVWLSEEEIAEIESLTSIGYARVYDRSGERDVSFGIFDKSPVLHCWYYADYDRYASALSYNEQIALSNSQTNVYETDYLAAHRGEEGKHCLSTNGECAEQSCVCLDEALFAECGGKILAGRLPVRADEIAINECQLAEFVRRGYCLYDDIASLDFVEPVCNDPYAESGYDPALPAWSIVNAEDIPRREDALVCEIKCAQDLIGKKIALKGELAGQASGYGNGSPFYLVTIVGVVETGCRGISDDYPWRLHDKIFVSESWAAATGQTGAFALLAARGTSEARVKPCIALYQKTYNEILSLPSGTVLPSEVLLLSQEHELDVLANILNGEFYAYRVALSFAGTVFGSFSVLLSYALISASIDKKRREIGILKSLGARSSDIYGIFLLQCLWIGAAVFVFALAVTIWVVCGLAGGYAFGAVRLMRVGALQIGVLLLLSAGIPIASGSLCVRAILRYPPTVIVLSRKERKKRRG